MENKREFKIEESDWEIINRKIRAMRRYPATDVPSFFCAYHNAAMLFYEEEAPLRFDSPKGNTPPERFIQKKSGLLGKYPFVRDILEHDFISSLSVFVVLNTHEKMRIALEENSDSSPESYLFRSGLESLAIFAGKNEELKKEILFFDFLSKIKEYTSFEIENTDDILDFHLYINEGDIFILFKNIERNPYKHGKATNIELSFKDNGDSMDFIFEDNGVGIDESKFEDANSIFEIGKTDGEGAGIGLRDLDERVKEYKGLHHAGIEGGAKIIITLDKKIIFNEKK